jgi:hypothetical protein
VEAECFAREADKAREAYLTLRRQQAEIDSAIDSINVDALQAIKSDDDDADADAEEDGIL